MEHRRVVLDFDGVLHDDRGLEWEGPEAIKGPPVEGALDFVRWLRRHDYEVVIFSARMCQDPDPALEYQARPPEDVRRAIGAWLRAHGFPLCDLNVYRSEYGKPGALLYVDDKGFRFEGQFPYWLLEEGGL